MGDLLDLIHEADNGGGTGLVNPSMAQILACHRARPVPQLRQPSEGVTHTEELTTSPYKRYIPGNVVKVRGAMGAGKTLFMVALVVDKLRRGIYQPSEVISNVAIPPYGVPAVTNAEIIKFLGEYVQTGQGHKILVIDEADQVFSHRTWSDKDKSKPLLSVWQIVKLGITLIYSIHEGLGVEPILRDATIMSIKPRISGNVLIAHVIDGRKNIEYTKYVYPTEAIFKLYSRWQPVT